ncbi:TonB-dependent receptor [Marinobacter sp.]|uniref:TonB-dependent receptor n=1 Tax=Marinobacter sp. TaxID=50741 RepID=UPI0034A4E284
MTNSILTNSRYDASKPGLRRNALFAAIASVTASMPVAAQETNNEPYMLDPLLVEFKAEQMNSPKYTRDLLDTPRIITVLPQDLLEEQNVTSVRDAMKNVSGISLQAGEGNPPSGDQLKIRGFNARDDININGTRDLGNYFRDPFYVDQIEVVKGPNSSFGGRGSAGGSINFVTKKPTQEDANRVEVSVGTSNLKRTTADLNKTVDANSAFRLNLMNHSSDIPGRDIAEEDRHGAYMAYTWGFQKDTRITADYLHTRQNDIPDAGLPFDRETRNDRGAATGKLPSGIDFSNFYGYRDDYRKIDVDQGGLTIEHSFSNQLAVRNQTRYSVVKNNSTTTSPRIRTQQDRDSANPGQGSLEGAFGIGDIKPRDQEDIGFNNQTDVLMNFDTGGVSHDMVAGFEVATLSQENERRPDVSGNDLRIDLFNPSYANRTQPRVEYDGSVHKFESEEYGVYLLDTLAFNPQWELNAGVRYDKVRTKASERGHELGLDGSPTRENIDPLRKTDEELSYNLGLVYKPIPSTSVYAAFGTAYEVSGTFDRNQVQLAGGGKREGDVPGQARPNDRAVASPDTFNIDPEETTAYELGVKWDVTPAMNLSAAVFRTDKTNARTPAIGGGDATTVLDGEQRVDGFEILAAGRLTDEWRLYSSYTFLDSEVRESNNPFEVGQRLGGTPRHTFNLFSTYDVTRKLTLGAGMQAVAEQTSNVQPQSDADVIADEGRLVVSIPGYTVFDAYATYRLTDQAQIRLNAFNVGDKEYISQMAEGGAQGIPGPGRQVVATLRYDF